MSSITNIVSTYRSGLRTGQRRIEIGQVIQYLGRVAPWHYTQPTEVEVPAPKQAKSYFERKLDAARSNDDRKFWSMLVEMQRKPLAGFAYEPVAMLPPGSYNIDSEIARGAISNHDDPRMKASMSGPVRLLCSNKLAGGAA